VALAGAMARVGMSGGAQGGWVLQSQRMVWRLWQQGVGECG